MNKGELVNEVCERLRASGVRKVISSPKHVFHITDDDGNTCNFNVKRSDRRISFNQKDVSLILDTCLDVIENICRGQTPLFEWVRLFCIALHHKRGFHRESP